MGKSKSYERSEGGRKHKRHNGQDIVEIMKPQPDGTYVAQYVRADIAKQYKRQQQLLENADKMTDEDQFRIAEATGLGFELDGRPKCLPGYQYRGSDGKCKVRPVDSFTATAGPQPTNITYNDGVSTKMVLSNGKILTLPGVGFPGALGGISAGPGGVQTSGFGNVQSGSAFDPEDSRVQSFRPAYPGAPWSKYSRDFSNDCLADELPTPNNQCVKASDMYKDGWRKAFYGPDKRVVAQPYQVSTVDMTQPPYQFRQWNTPSAALRTPYGPRRI